MRHSRVFCHGPVVGERRTVRHTGAAGTAELRPLRWSCGERGRAQRGRRIRAQQTGVAWQPGSYALTAAFAEPLIKIVTSTVEGIRSPHEVNAWTRSRRPYGYDPGTTRAGHMPAKADKEILIVDGTEIAVSNPAKVLFPQAGHTKLDLVRYYLAVADGALRGRRRPAERAGAISERHRRRVLLPEARARVATRVDRGRRAAVSVRPHGRRGRAAHVRGARLDGESRLPRAAPASGPRRGSRSSRRAARRSRSGARRGVAAAPRGRAGRPRDAGGLRARRLAEDVGLARDPHQRADRAAHGRSTRSAAPRSRLRARSSGARLRWRRASGGRKSATASSSTTTRTPRIARWPRAYSVRPKPDARVSAPLTWDEIDDCDPADFTLRRCRRGSQRSAIGTRRSTRRPARSSASSSCRRGTSGRGRATPRGRRSTRSSRASRRASSRRAAECRSFR